jgi:hypothetical protein
MRVAWFTPSRTPGDEVIPPDDDTALLVRALRARHVVELVDERRAHDFIWQHARRPHDLCVFELGGSPAHQFIAAYAVHFPGLVLLRGLPRYDHALLAARMVVVPHEPVAEALADDYPGARIRTLAPGVEPLPDTAPAIVNALRWPPDGAALTYAMAGLAAGRAVIVFDGPDTADWPSLDPQNWEPRGPGDPICVGIDPRDERHSLALALRRLESDAALRERLGAAATAWWRQHATVRMAADRFELLLEEATSISPPPVAGIDDGSRLAESILHTLGVEPRTGALPLR